MFKLPTILTAHKLAQELLAMPDKPITVWDTGRDCRTGYIELDEDQHSILITNMPNTPYFSYPEDLKL